MQFSMTNRLAPSRVNEPSATPFKSMNVSIPFPFKIENLARLKARESKFASQNQAP